MLLVTEIFFLKILNQHGIWGDSIDTVAPNLLNEDLSTVHELLALMKTLMNGEQGCDGRSQSEQQISLRS